MRAAAIDGFGGIERISMRSVPVPEIGPGDVLIRVEAAGVGSWDAVEREGQYDGAFGFESTFPYVLGWDGAGTVAAVGERISRLAVGDRVYAASMPLPKGGFYAEYAAVEEDYVSHVPSHLTIEQATAMPWDALTALSGLDVLNLEPGTTLMIVGASGGIGHMAIQIAKRMGARILAVASGDDGVALANRLGADALADGRQDDVVAAVRDFAPGGLDAALVTIGGEAVDRALTAIRDRARVACPYGVVPEPQIPPGRHLILYNGERSPAATSRLNHLIDSGPFEVHVARTFSLDQASAAHRSLEEHYLGKLALRVDR
ncbi:MAG: zinc-binding dehydrogenase [Gemmatimonas sp.]|nr:zinc-binding dehydrogenase [Gemmatimonas sp.]